MKYNVVYIISNINKALAFEWIAEELDKDKYILSFILLNPGDSVLEQYLKRKGVSVRRITYHGKKNFPMALWRVMGAIIQLNAHVIHTHLFDASLIGLLAAMLLRIPKRIHTRHHATMHHEYFPKAVYYDRLISFLATDIIAISSNVKQVLLEKENVSAKKITLIHHGFRLEAFQQVSEQRVIQLKGKYKMENCWPVVGVISRFIHLKGLQYIIPAFEKLLAEYPNACLVLANAQGNYNPEIQKLLSNHSPGQYRQITFEEDLCALYRLFDIFVHVPINESVEAFGQTYVEALAAGIPSIFTLSGVATEFIRDGENAWVVPFMDADAIYHSLLLILSGDKEKIDTVIAQGKKDVQERFSLQKMITGLEQLYAIQN